MNWQEKIALYPPGKSAYKYYGIGTDHVKLKSTFAVILRQECFSYASAFSVFPNLKPR